MAFSQTALILRRKEMEMVTKIYGGVRTANKNKRRRLSWWAVGAIFGMVGAVIFPIFGALVLEAIKRGAEISPFLKTFALVLAASTIPLLIFGAYCLDVAVERALPKRNYAGSRRQIPDPRKRAKNAPVTELKKFR
jgi:hypothetical protein